MRLYRENDIQDIPWLTHHHLLGNGVFETLRTYNGRPAFLEMHVDRLLSSAETLSIRHNFTKKKILSFVSDALIKDMYDTDFVIRIFLSASGDLSISKDPWKGYPKRFYNQGMKLCVSRWRRVPGVSFPSGVKSTSYAGFMLIQREAMDKGFDDAVILTLNGYICETSRSNIFIVKEGDIYTPHLKYDVFPGITRHIIIKIAKDLGFTIVEDKLEIDDLLTSSEMFLTSSLLEVAPVTSLEGKKISSGKPGDVYRQLRKHYLSSV